MDTVPKSRKRNSLCSFLSWLTHTNVIKKIFTIACFMNLTSNYNFLQAQRLSRDLEIDLLTNQVGYLPSSTKTCVMPGPGNTDFEVVEIISGQVAYRGNLV